ncbi:MAG: hypothetical protein M1837_002701 [Sclerophora amabilis]|nr:MAG: hypothetical protein M1837_002701 [Sclerophora amabilis]
MRSFLLLSALTALTATVRAQQAAGVPHHAPEDPVVSLVNKGNEPRVVVVETSAGVPSTAYHGDPISVPGQQTVDFYPGAGFIGALTGADGTGTRHEINFADNQVTWYNSDMEMGMCDSTLGPTSGEPQNNGQPSLAGEANRADKANQAWGSVDPQTQQNLLDSGYIDGTVGGSVTGVRMDKQAPQAVIDFLQVTANFNAYVTHGSVGGSDKTNADKIANQQTRNVGTNKMTITMY